MNAIHRILVPIDFSEHSSHAIRFAADLARRYRAELHLLHVVTTTAYTLPDGTSVPGPEQLELIFSDAERLLSMAKADALAAGAPRVDILLLAGNAAQEILERARASGCDLIVMGTHGRGGVKRWVLGSVAERVVRHADCPVLTVRAPERAADSGASTP